VTLERYRRSLLILVSGAIVSGAAVGTVWWPVALLVAISLLVALRVSYARIGCGTAALALLVGMVHPLEQALLPPSYVTALLVAVVSVVCAGPRARRELDAALIGAAGVVVIDASAAIGFVPALTLVPCIALLVAALWYRQRTSGNREPLAVQALPPGRLIPVALVVIGIGMLAVPAPASTGFHVSLFHHPVGTGTSEQSVDRTSLGGNTLDLDLRGPLGDAPVLTVTANAPDLWRGEVFQTYDGRTWSIPSGPPAVHVVAAGNAVPYPPDALDPVPPGPAVDVSATWVGPAYDGTLVAPGVVMSVTASVPLTRSVPGAARLESPYASGYSASVVLPITDRSRLAGADGADPVGWTQLPAELPQRVRGLAASITAGAPSRPAKVAAVESYLREHERYTLEAPVPGRGQDAVDAFLFGSHEGFCEQFASAEVVLLRSVGIPARLATGYAYGTVSGTGRLFDQSNAHAWVEVAYPGLGWSPSDPTAGAPILPGRHSFAARLQSFVANLGSTPYRRAATAGVLALLVAGWAGAHTGLRRRRRRHRPAVGPVTAAFARLEPRWPRDPANTPREWVVSMSEPDLADALAVWETELFAAVPPDGSQVRRAVTSVSTVRRGAHRDHTA
jgi:transglutaminase-like putative cysteine protease